VVLWTLFLALPEDECSIYLFPGFRNLPQSKGVAGEED